MKSGARAIENSRRFASRARNRWVLAVGCGLLALTVGWLMPRGGERQAAVASVESEDITADEFRARYAAYLVRTGLPDEPPVRTRFLQALVEERLFAREALDAGLVELPAYRVAEERYRRKFVVDLYVRRTLYDTIRVRESELQEAFRRLNTSLQARHLYASTLREAEALQVQLEAGASFEALARATFSDSTLASSGGLLGYFSFDEMDPAFEDAAFALDVGDTSGPVRTAQGYSIIQLLDRRIDPVVPATEYANRRRTLHAIVLDRRRTEARRAYARALAETIDLTFEPAALGALYGQIDGTLVHPDAESFAAWLAQPLLHFHIEGRPRTWTVGMFQEHGQYTDPAQRAQVRTPEDLRTFVEGLVVREIMLERARSGGLDDAPELETALQQTMTEWLAAAARRRVSAGTADSMAATVLAQHVAALRERYEVRIDLDALAGLPLTTSSTP